MCTCANGVKHLVCLSMAISLAGLIWKVGYNDFKHKIKNKLGVLLTSVILCIWNCVHFPIWMHFCFTSTEIYDLLHGAGYSFSLVGPKLEGHAFGRVKPSLMNYAQEKVVGWKHKRICWHSSLAEAKLQWFGLVVVFVILSLKHHLKSSL